MKNKFTFLLFLSLATSSFAQFQIVDDGVVVESPSTEVVEPGYGVLASREYKFVNNTAGDLQIKVKRVRLFDMGCVAPNTEQICFDALCYLPEDETEYTTPEPPEIEVGDTLNFKVGLVSTEDCCGIYRYYIQTGLGATLDSIDVKYRVGTISCFLSDDKEELKNEITLYPNPTNTNFTISNTPNDGILNIYNQLGEKVISQVLLNENTTISVNELSNGIYFCEVIDKDGSLIKQEKLVIEKN